jgi:hypothetical protein
MSAQKIVVRYIDGRILKGHTLSFNPAGTSFVLTPVGNGSKQVVVEMNSVKAVFFVRDFAGRPGRQKSQGFHAGQPYQGRKAKVRFNDGEVLAGFVSNYDPQARGFFLFPADEGSNNIKAYVTADSVDTVSFV